jgi:hypothetical protein
MICRASAKAIVHNSGAFVEDADLALFGILQSAWFTAWQATVGGRIKSDYRFNNRLVYNTFPFVGLDSRHRAHIELAADEVLAARAAHPDASLADLYDPIATPADLVAAHRGLDRAVDLAFSSRHKFSTDVDRLRFLFDRYAIAAGAGQLTVGSGATPSRSPSASGAGLGQRACPRQMAAAT